MHQTYWHLCYIFLSHRFNWCVCFSWGLFSISGIYTYVFSNQFFYKQYYRFRKELNPLAMVTKYHYANELYNSLSIFFFCHSVSLIASFHTALPSVPNFPTEFSLKTNDYHFTCIIVIVLFNPRKIYLYSNWSLSNSNFFLFPSAYFI